MHYFCDTYFIRTPLSSTLEEREEENFRRPWRLVVEPDVAQAFLIHIRTISGDALIRRFLIHFACRA